MTCTNPVIGVDLDDVLWDLKGAWLRRYNEIEDTNITAEDIKSWDIGKYVKPGTESVLFYILEQNDFWETVKPVDGAQHYLNQLIEDGYDVYIVTASPHIHLKQKLIHFYKLFPFINPEQVVIIHRKQMMDLDVLIDDKPSNLCDASYKKILFDCSHNRGFDEQQIGALRVTNWNDVYDFICEEFPIGRRKIERDSNR